MARKFVKEGHRVIKPPRAERLRHLQEGPRDACCRLRWMTDKTMIEQALAALPAAWKPIDVLINNAGLARGRPGA